MTTPAHGSSRKRVSIWADRNFINDASLKDAEHIVDDISIIRLIQHTENLSQPINLIPLDTQKKQQCADIIRACHKRNIQILAGYGFAENTQPNESKRFNAWLKQLAESSAAAREAEIDRFALQFIELLNTKFDGVLFDGINFDIESMPFGTDRQLASKMGDALSRFVLTLHDGLNLGLTSTGSDPLLLNRLVGVAAGHLVGHDLAGHAPPRFKDAVGNPLKNDFVAHFQPLGLRASKDEIKGAFNTPPNGIVHKYTMAADRQNILVRPMAYDNFSVLEQFNSTTARQATPAEKATQISNKTLMERLRQWHRDMVDYALSENDSAGIGANLRPGQFQLGIKTFKGGSNNPDSSNFINLDGVMDDNAEVRSRCLELRKRGVGLIIFAFPENPSPTFWTRVKECNFALNAIKEPDPGFVDNPSAESTFKPASPSANTILPAQVSRPDQAPHTESSLQRMKQG